MPRRRLIEAAVLNVTLPYPSRDNYTLLIESLFAARRPIQVRGTEFMMLTSIFRPKEGGDVYTGAFARFTEIDPNLPWFNIESLGEAKDNELAEVQIPENLRPNFSSFYFQFDAAVHLLVFETRGPGEGVSPRQVEKFIRRLVEAVEPELGVAVNLISEQSSVQTILSMSILKHLKIVLEMPNPDLNEELEEQLKERLREQNARRMTEQLDALPSQSLVPDTDTVALATVAAANGEVQGAGSDNGVPKMISTKNYPLKSATKYDPELTSDRQAFEAAAEEVKQKRRDSLAAQRRRVR